MNKEIEELLNELKDEDNYIEEYGFKYKRIGLGDWWLLLSYIEQLEKKYKELKDRNEITIDRNIEAYRIVEQLENNRDKVIEICDFYNKKYQKDPLENQKVLFVISNVMNVLKGDSNN